MRKEVELCDFCEEDKLAERQCAKCMKYMCQTHTEIVTFLAHRGKTDALISGLRMYGPTWAEYRSDEVYYCPDCIEEVWQIALTLDPRHLATLIPHGVVTSCSVVT
ncbi:MAG: hypothetical protein ACXABY_36530 [Candidatus Thorarchaeota archaeon]|jgi:hypothetical protein